MATFRAQERLRKDLIQWLKWLQQHVGFNGWRFDFVKGYAGDAVKVGGSTLRMDGRMRGCSG